MPTDDENDQAVMDSNYLIGTDAEETMMNCTCVLEFLEEHRSREPVNESDPNVETGEKIVMHVVIDALRKQVASIENNAKQRRSSEASHG